MSFAVLHCLTDSNPPNFALLPSGSAAQAYAAKCIKDGDCVAEIYEIESDTKGDMGDDEAKDIVKRHLANFVSALGRRTDYGKAAGDVYDEPRGILWKSL